MIIKIYCHLLYQNSSFYAKFRKGKNLEPVFKHFAQEQYIIFRFIFYLFLYLLMLHIDIHLISLVLNNQRVRNSSGLLMSQVMFGIINTEAICGRYEHCLIIRKI